MSSDTKKKFEQLVRIYNRINELKDKFEHFELSNDGKGNLEIHCQGMFYGSSCIAYVGMDLFHQDGIRMASKIPMTGGPWSTGPTSCDLDTAWTFKLEKDLRPHDISRGDFRQILDEDAFIKLLDDYFTRAELFISTYEKHFSACEKELKIKLMGE